MTEVVENLTINNRKLKLISVLEIIMTFLIVFKGVPPELGVPAMVYLALIYCAANVADKFAFIFGKK